MDDSSVIDEDVATRVLGARPSRAPDYERENRALAELADAMAQSPGTVLQKLVELVVASSQADSAGVSILETDATGMESFRWHAVAGDWAPLVGGRMSRSASPCGEVIDRDISLLLREPGRRYPDAALIDPPVVELLLTPFHVEQRAIGTVWAVSHDPHRQFDAEDLRLLGSLSRFASAAHRAISAATELRASEAQFRALAQAMPHHVWMAPPDGLLDWFNQRIYDYTGATPGDLERHGWRHIMHPTDMLEAAERWQAALLNGDTYEAEFRLLRHDGVYRWHLTRALPIRDEQGAIIRWVGTNTDIEEQKTTSQALARLNETLEQQVAERTADRNRLWQLSSDIMILSRLDGTLLAVNPAWTRVLGWSAEESIGRDVLDFIHADGLEKARHDMSVFEDGVSVSGVDNLMLHKDGGCRWIVWGAVSGDGLISGVGRDVTLERERAEALHLAEEQLRQSQKMEAIGQLTGGIAHDFNNLLTVIIGSLDMLKRRMDAQRSDGVERFMDAASSAAQRAAALIHRLLAFARRQSLDTRPCDVNLLIEGLDDMLRRTLGERISLETALHRHLWHALSDANQLESALVNLAINARDAMPSGGQLSIDTANTVLDDSYTAGLEAVSSGEYVVISVSDTGSGMSAEVLAKAFDPFFTTKPLGQGTGLGLSMIYGYAKQSGGHVRIYSEVNRGTTVKLYLRRAPDEQAPLPIESPRAPYGLGETVLVVEDEASVRMLISEVLDVLGYRYLEAADAKTALELLQREPQIDLLVTDVGLPDMNGRQLADIAREERPQLRVLFVTGYAEAASVRGGVLAEGMQMMTKPFALDALGSKIREMLER